MTKKQTLHPQSSNSSHTENTDSASAPQAESNFALPSSDNVCGPYQDLFNNHVAAQLIVDPKANAILLANQAAADFYGYSIEEIQTLPVSALSARAPHKVSAILQRAEPNKAYHYISRHKTKSGEVKAVDLYASIQESPLGLVAHVIVHDITSRYQALEKLREREAMLTAFTNGSRDALVMVNAKGEIILWNTAAEDIFGYTSDEVIGKEVHSILAPPEDMKVALPALNIFSNTGEGALIDSVRILRGRKKDGAYIPIELSLSAFKLKGEWHAAGVLRDVTERIQQEEELQRLATTDVLTGLANRRRFFERAEEEFTRFQRHGAVFSVLMIDADRFKNVNDKYGHETGDKVLTALAKALSSELRKGDVAARIGGEEFALLLPDTPEDKAKRVAQRVLDNVRALRVPHDNTHLTITVSIGVSSSDKNVSNFEDIMRQADKALYCAKEQGRDTVVLQTHQQ